MAPEQVIMVLGTQALLDGKPSTSSGGIKFRPVTLTFQDLRYSVPMPHRDRKSQGLAKNAQLELLKVSAGV
jgi:hypothetical protein